LIRGSTGRRRLGFLEEEMMPEGFAETVRRRTKLGIVLICLLALSGCLSISSRDYDDDDGYYHYRDGRYYHHYRND
jgi:hypothetical protein